jgi:hypothetical protein
MPAKEKWHAEHVNATNDEGAPPEIVGMPLSIIPPKELPKEASTTPMPLAACRIGDSPNRRRVARISHVELRAVQS